MTTAKGFGQLVGSIDEGTSSARFLVSYGIENKTGYKQQIC